MQQSMWTYAWDILDLGFDTVLGELRDRAGLNCISLASSYHAGRFLQPRSPKRKAYFPEDGTIYFHPTPGRWEGSRDTLACSRPPRISAGSALEESVSRHQVRCLDVPEKLWKPRLVAQLKPLETPHHLGILDRPPRFVLPCWTNG